MLPMIEFLLLLLATVCDRGDLVAENLLLRHQLAVLTRPTANTHDCAPVTGSSG